MSNEKVTRVTTTSSFPAKAATTRYSSARWSMDCTMGRATDAVMDVQDADRDTRTPARPLHSSRKTAAGSDAPAPSSGTTVSAITSWLTDRAWLNANSARRFTPVIATTTVIGPGRGLDGIAPSPSARPAAW